MIDSFPIPVCDNLRINRCRIYRRNDPWQDTDGAFRGYVASKRRYFYGLKIHVLVTKEGLPVEVFSDSRRVE